MSEKVQMMSVRTGLVVLAQMWVVLVALEQIYVELVALAHIRVLLSQIWNLWDALACGMW